MAVHKILLDDDFAEDFSLIAIHCSEDAFKIAYALNKHLNVRLKRRSTDLDFTIDQQQVSFPIFEFEDEFQYTTYYLVGNKCKSILQQTAMGGGLFNEEPSETVRMNYLLPEFKKADYFLKIESDFEQIPLRRILALINEIKQVISAYEIDTQRIKSNNHLIFN